MKRKIIIVALVLLAAVAIAFKLRNNTKAAEKEVSEELRPISLKLDTTLVVERPREESFLVTGTTEPNALINVISETEGKVVSSSLAVGKIVRKGQVLVQLNTELKNATHKVNLVTYQKAKQDYDRLVALLQENNASQAELDQALLQLRTAEQQVAISAKQLEQSMITAPVSGVVVEKKANAGEVVMTGNSLAVIAEVDPLVVKLFLSESQALQVKTGQDVTISADALGHKVFQGKVTAIVPVATQSKSFPVEISLPNAGQQQLMAGVMVSVKFSRGQGENVILIPRTSVITSGNGTYVYVLNGREVHKRPVSIGTEHGTSVAITNGLKVGEVIVTRGQQTLENEARIANYTIVR
jgi:membrane fusion protein, multidrug efflux system